MRRRELIPVEPSRFMSSDQKDVFPGSRTVERGSFGGDVAWLQRRLGVPETGMFGLRTVEAVERLQCERGLLVTGVCDYETWALLGAVERWGFPLDWGEHFGPGDCSRCVVVRMTKRGDRSLLERIQKKLGVARTGVYDRATEVAVQRWQRSHRVEVTGRIDLYTWVQMVSR